MPLAQLFKNEFSSTVRQKGKSYFQGAHVYIKSVDDSGFRAEVLGSRRTPYQVSFDWSDAEDGVLAICNCPHYESGFSCKHLWAAILAADQQGIHLPEGCLAELLYDGDDAYEYDDDEYDDDIFSLINRQTLNDRTYGRNKQPSNSQSSQKPIPWDRQLGQWPKLPRHADVQKESRPPRVLFVIDVAASYVAGAIVLTLYQQDQRKDGEWGKVKVLKTSRGKLASLSTGFSPEDQRRLALILGNFTGSLSSYINRVPLHANYENQVSQVEILPTLHEWLLPELCAEERLSWVLSSDQSLDDRRVCTWDAGPPWEFRLIFEDDPKRKCWTVRGELVRGKQTVPLADVVLLLSSGLALFPDSLARLTPPTDWRWLALLRSANQLEIPYADREKLITELYVKGGGLECQLPASLQAETVKIAPQGCLRIHAPKKQVSSQYYHNGQAGYLHADFLFDYVGQQILPDDFRGVLAEAESNRIILRDTLAEHALEIELHSKEVSPYKPVYASDPPGNARFKQQQLERIVDELTQTGWQIWAEGRKVKRPGEFRANVVSGVDWFDLETHVDFEGQSVNLPQLLKALQNNEHFIVLDNSTQALLPREWLDKFAPLARFAEIEGDRMRFRPSQALLLDALLEDRATEVDVQVDRQFKRFREKLRSFDGVKPREAPAGFRGTLRPYQKEGLGWMAFLEEFGLNGCLADDMGLGKTVQVLAWLVARQRRRQNKPTLIVAPKSVVTNWQLEAERFAPRLKVLNFTGVDRIQHADKIGDAHVVITTYGTMRNDIELLKEVPFDYAILDEAQAIKNDKSVSAKACRLLQADHRLALTGTPVENHLGDLWSIFEFLNPGMMGRSNALKSYGNGNDEGKSLETLRRALAPFILRRTKEKVLKDLPKKSEQILNVELLPADRKRYNELRDYYRDSIVNRASKSGMNAVRMHVLEALLRLRQVACHAGLVDKKLVKKPSAKLEVLLDNITEVVDEGHKALVFSQFTSLLTIVKETLDRRKLRYEYLDGRTRNRQERIDRFQSDADCPLFLISLKAGGTGLNLTAADYVFLMDPWWNPAVEKQAIDRAHRLGQSRPVFAYRLVSSDTVEEKIIELQAKKRELADAIISGDKSVLTGLTLEDLQLLLS